MKDAFSNYSPTLEIILSFPWHLQDFLMILKCDYVI